MTLTRIAFFVALSFFCICLSIGTADISLAAEPAGDLIDSSRVESPEFKSLSKTLTHYIMGIIYDNFGNTGLAIDEYNEALSHKNDVSEIYLRLGADLLVSGELEKAEEALARSTQMDPADTKPYLLLAIIYTAKGDYQKAESQYEEALKYDPENLRLLMFLSDLFVVQQKLDKAAEVYERIVGLRSDDAFIYFNLGVIYSKLNRMDKAMENLEKAIRIDTDYIEAQMVLGFIYEIDGKTDKAIEQYEKVIDLDPVNGDAYARLGQVYFKAGNSGKAIEQNRILMRLDPKSPGPYLKIFNVHISDGKYGEAKKILGEALDNGIADAEVYASLGYLAVLEKNYKKAIENYTAAVKKDPGNHLYEFYLGAAVERYGDKERAVRILEGLIAKSPHFPEVYNYLGYLYAEKGVNLDRAIMLIQKALELDPGNGAYLDSLGWAYYKKGMLEESLDKLEKAAESLPDDPVVRDHLEEVREQIRKSREAE